MDQAARITADSADVESKLNQNKPLAKTSLMKYLVDALRKVCEAHSLSVGNSGKRGGPTKPDYVAALLQFQLRRISLEQDVEMSSDEQGEQSRGKKRNADEPNDERPMKLPIPKRVQPSTAPRAITVRVHKSARSWHHMAECRWTPSANGDINLVALGEQLNLRGELRVIDPKNFRPLFRYASGVLQAVDVDRCMTDGCLRVIVIPTPTTEGAHRIQLLQL
ncbi:hypothetical protein BD410DRAFT_838556 [Rickenella mellea]|uniref:Uncharacterized protein n=1 Tax=Rickenella mellea TaxID=50990 RepID=A0A4Y7Q8X5_9AGAM|nr:hypothetical protein BD410DRAFT_838556 [Rickenella mellea]